MNLLREGERSWYATLGAGRWFVDSLRDVWEDRENWTGRAGETYDELVERGRGTWTEASRQARREGRQARESARRVPGVAPLEGELSGLAADEGKLPLEGYDTRTASEIVGRLPHLSQRELHRVEGYEATHRARSTVLDKVDALRGNEPWPGYDEMTVDEISGKLPALSAQELDEAATYEGRHKARSTLDGAFSRARAART